jgi:hypothetical protein
MPVTLKIKVITYQNMTITKVALLFLYEKKVEKDLVDF